MKRNKIRIDARIKPYLRKRMEAVAEKLESSYTELIEDCLEKGLSWYIKKIRRELDKKFLEAELPPNDNKDNKPRQEKPKPKEEDEEMTYEEWYKIMLKMYPPEKIPTKEEWEKNSWPPKPKN